ncbi:hypothetical protein D3C87_2178720 [compost metagenome]
MLGIGGGPRSDLYGYLHDVHVALFLVSNKWIWLTLYVANQGLEAVVLREKWIRKITEAVEASY